MTDEAATALPLDVLTGDSTTAVAAAAADSNAVENTTAAAAAATDTVAATAAASADTSTGTPAPIATNEDSVNVVMTEAMTEEAEKYDTATGTTTTMDTNTTEHPTKDATATTMNTMNTTDSIGTTTGSTLDEAVQQAVSVSEQALREDMERQVHQFMLDKQALERTVSSALATVKEWQQRYTELNDATAAKESWSPSEHGPRAHEQAKTLQTTNTNLQERLDRMQTEADALRAEISRLTTRNTALTIQVQESTVTASLSESNVLPLHHQTIRLQTEVDQWTTHCTWLEGELHAQQQQSLALQHEARQRYSLQQEQMHRVEQALADAQAQVRVQQGRFDETSRQLENAMGEARDWKMQLAQVTQTAEEQVQQDRNLVQAQAEQLQVWQRRYDDVVRQQEQWQATANSALQKGQAEWDEAQNQIEHKYRVLLEEQAEAYERKLTDFEQNESSMTLRLTNAVLPASTTVTAADSPPRDEPEVLSMMDLYEELARTKKALSHETCQHQKYRLLLQRVQTSIAAKSTELIRQRDEYELAVHKAQEYARRLTAVLADRDHARTDRDVALAQTATMERQVKALKDEVHALAHQVQQLLLASVSQNGESANVDEIALMQNQNQRLLSEHRRLTNQVAELEGRLETDDLVTQLERANQERQTLQQERHVQETLVTQIVQQRDLYRALLNQKDGATRDMDTDDAATAVTVAKQQSERAQTLQQQNEAFQAQLKGAQLALDDAVRENGLLSQRIARFDAAHTELMDRITTLESDLIATRGQAARHEADAAYHTSKCEQLNVSLEHSRTEAHQIKEARLELHNINAGLQLSISALQEERATLQHETQAAQAKLRLIETQWNSSKAMEERLTQDIKQLRVDNTRYGDFIESLQRVEATLSARAVEERESLQSQLAQAKAMLALAETKLSTNTENAVARTSELEGRLEDLSRQNEKNQADSLQAKTALLQTQTELQTLQAKCTKLEAHLRAAKKKLGLADSSDAEADDVEVVMQSRIDALEIELAHARSEMTGLEERVESYKNVALTSEAALKDVKSTTTAFLNEQQVKYKELQNLYENTQKNNTGRQAIIRDLTNDLASQRDERDVLEADLKSQILTLEATLRDQDHAVTSAQAQVAAMVQDVETWRQEANTAQNNYERELSVHAQARTALRTAHDAVDKMTDKYHVAEKLLATLRQELDQEKDLLQQEMMTAKEASRLVESSLRESRDQNKVLHSRLETLNSVVEKSQAARIATATGTDSTGNDSSVKIDSNAEISEIKELLRFLRSENELLQTQLDTAKRTAEREKSAANVIRQNVDQVRSELKEMQTRVLESTGSNAIDESQAAADLRARDDQLVLLKDSNTLLRNELDIARSDLAASHDDIQKLRKLVEPTDTVQRELGMKIKTLETEKESLVRELDSWKTRMKNLVSSVNQIDPEEHRLLQQKLDEVTKSAETQSSAHKSTEEEVVRIRGLAKRVNLQNQENQKNIEAQKKVIAQLTSDKEVLANASSARIAAHKEVEELKQRLVKLEKDADSAGTALTGTNERNDRLREKLREFQKGIRESRAKEMFLMEQLEAAQRSVAALTKASLGSSIDSAPVKAPDSSSMVSQSLPGIQEGVQTTHEPPTASPTPKQIQLDNFVAKEILPTAPQEGFLFGPSKGTWQSKGNTATVSASASASNLRSGAASFKPARAIKDSQPECNVTPVKSTARGTTVGAHSPLLIFPSPDPHLPPSATLTKEASTSTTESVAPRRMSGDTKEEEFKKRLLEKKRRLAEHTKLLKRKQQVEEADRTQTAEKKVKMNNALDGASTFESTLQVQALHATRLPAKGSVESQGMASKSGLTFGEPDSIGDSNVRLDAVRDEPLEPAESSSVSGSFGTGPFTWNSVSATNNPFGVVSSPFLNASAASTTFGQSSTLSSPFVTMTTPPSSATSFFGSNAAQGVVTQPSTSFGSSTTVETPVVDSTLLSSVPPAVSESTAVTTVQSSTSSFGSGAFLDIKPPSSSSSGVPPPTFTFGTSSSITLPTPTLPSSGPTASPFGAFGTFGGGLGAPPASMQARPLFGAVVVAALNPPDEDAMDKLADADADEEEVAMQDEQ